MSFFFLLITLDIVVRCVSASVPILVKCFMGQEQALAFGGPICA